MVVVSDSGAAPETVVAPPQAPAQGRTGWRVPPGDALALADALMSALSLGATARDAIAQRARAHVEANFSLEQMTEKTLAAYRAALTR
jgi:glycosyltransferase involved in cell wall biosynthesis